MNGKNSDSCHIRRYRGEIYWWDREWLETGEVGRRGQNDPQRI